MYDFHVHTHFSDDCSHEMESYIAPAIAKGLRGICFTDHIDIDYPCNDVKFQLNYLDYSNEIKRLKDRYEDKIEIFTGIEFGVQPHILDSDQSFFKDKSFDYVIGSLHTAGRKELYGGDFLKEKKTEQGIKEYFEDMIFCVSRFENFNNLGHIDAINRYVPEGSYTADEHLEYIDEVLKILIKKGKGIEINTSGRRYGLPDFHPELEIVKLYKNLGGEIVTLGSDSHSPNTLGWGFSEAAEMLKHCGFKYHSIFRNGKPEFIRL